MEFFFWSETLCESSNQYSFEYLLYPETRRARNFLAIIIRASILNPQIETFFVLSGYTCKYDLPVYSIQFLQKEIQFSESCLFLYIKCIVVNQIRLWSCVFFTSKFLIFLRTLTSPCICRCRSRCQKIWYCFTLLMHKSHFSKICVREIRCRKVSF